MKTATKTRVYQHPALEEIDKEKRALRAILRAIDSLPQASAARVTARAHDVACLGMDRPVPPIDRDQ